VHVSGGTAVLRGHLPPPTHDLAYRVASGTRGVRRVDCAIRDRGRRRGRVDHVHGIDVTPPVPPMPR
jgi:hypothetical protein